MTTKEELQQTYSLWSTEKLCAVLFKPSDYIPEAESVAREELSRRAVPQEEIDAHLLALQEVEEKKANSKQQRKHDFDLAAGNVLDAMISHDEEVDPIVFKRIRSLFFFSLLVMVFAIIRFSRSYINMGSAGFDLPTLFLDLHMPVLLFIGGVWLNRLSAAGWYVFTIVAIYVVYSNVVGILVTLFTMPETANGAGWFVTSVLPLILYWFIAYRLLDKQMRLFFKVVRRDMFTVFLVPLIMTAALFTYAYLINF